MKPFFSFVKVFLYPFALIYGAVVWLRNKLYETGFFSSVQFSVPVITVGNLSVGGTGKTPHVEYLIRLLQYRYRVATMSRGYKRRTQGFLLANADTNALRIGDEPMQFHLKFPEVPVAVGEERIISIPYLIEDCKDLQAIILDDAFQHRSVQAGFNILLTEYSNLYLYDFFLPTGDLRDEWRSAKRADIIVVTKCPPDLSADKKQKIIESLHATASQKIFFTAIEYGLPYHIISNQIKNITIEDEILLVCGIANPKPLKEYLVKNARTYYQKDYNDHHIFSIDDLNEIKQRFNEMDANNKFILTTEKDAVRLHKFDSELNNIPLYVLPVKHKFLFNEGELFNAEIISFIKNFSFNLN